jgi:hypothetical protein
MLIFCFVLVGGRETDSDTPIKKENFPHISGNSEWSSCKVIYEEGLPNIMYEEMRKYFPIYGGAVSHI